ncbi:MAG TPA: hypothetical protein VFC54_13355 [Pseudolabrys sp.]|nr:hypothetical protein [Pseudolabrys sp.]
MTRHRRALILAAGFIVAMIVIVFIDPRIAAAGWLIAFNYVAAFPLGALALIMIHRLTGGRWGDALLPVLLPLARCTLLLVVLVLPVAIGAFWFLPEQARIGELTPSVASIYLNAPSFAARSLIGVVGLGMLALFVPRGGRLVAGLGLFAYAVVISFLALDWNLAIEPPFFSTSFGASVAITQLLAVLALGAVLDAAPRDRADLGGLLLTVTLGITYLDFMAVLVIWYGDLPAKTFWFTERLNDGWLALAVATFVIGSLLPVAMLMFARVRRSHTGLGIAGVCELFGLALYQTWLIGPAFGVAAVLAAMVAFGAMTALIIAAILGDWPLDLPARWRTAHGA